MPSDNRRKSCCDCIISSFCWCWEGLKSIVYWFYNHICCCCSTPYNGVGYKNIADIDVACEEINDEVVRNHLRNENVQNLVEKIASVLNIIQISRHADLLRHTKLNIYKDFKFYRFVSGNAAHQLLFNITTKKLDIVCMDFPPELAKQISIRSASID